MDHEQTNEAPQAAVRGLEEALRSMTWRVEPGSFALAGFPSPPTSEDLKCLGQPPAQVVREGGETTLLAPAAALRGLSLRHPEAQVETPLRWIRFELPMSWELCGFLAHVTGALAAAGIPLGAVCGFSRDHLFIPERHLPSARAVLEQLFGPEEGGGSRAAT